ncbi:16S rRNA (guanine(527)-N(7))-methyltransferase RsmG [Aestuariivirga litoralis]|uniref:16S rRNA (guanine(527)-N(7))-methyltransferase RsmG n=1 Tax=Aestuariivirga litoralis TaxID=2650924 RepID=UPI0018C45E47|nr:16S rRNA (guanine(527)-N(7))-methyltransferase RsmG [Aestuariivirga litoralis]MBG1233769.1 16S rRNA (guanine(527)-N(7))-methyltransferase RsmG [Aestuariivirga litoralis]
MNPIPQETWDRLNVSRESIARLEVLASLLGQWQKHINLIGPASLPDIWTRHIVDSAQLLPLVPGGMQAIADLGSGGGFPSLVLAATQAAHVHFYESNAKKVSFLQEALRQMGVKGSVHRERLELDAAPKSMPEVQLVTARAFAPLDNLLAYASPFMAKGAIALFHKGQDVDAELAQAAKSWKITAVKHSSITDADAVILEVKEAKHGK